MSLVVSGATVTVLPGHAAGPIELVQRTGKRLEFVAQERMLPGALIRIESGALLLFGEVIAAFQETGSFRILAEVEHLLDRAKAL